MKQSCRKRCIFLIACTIIMLYLGFKTDKLSLCAGREELKYDLIINEVMKDNRNSIKDEEGDFEDWIEIYNKGDTTVSLKGFGLSTDSKQPFLWTFPDMTIEPKAFVIVWASEKNKCQPNNPLHTNFKIKNKDNVLILTAPNKSWDDIFVLEAMAENISYGRVPDGGAELYGFDGGTPGEANICEKLIEGSETKRLDSPAFSHNGGFYTQEFDLVIKANDADAEIYYTLDGSVPTKESKRYLEPIPIAAKSNKASVVRARTYREGYPKSDIITQSYFVGKDIYSSYNIPVISLVTDPENLFDYEKGIYVAGKVFDEWEVKNPNGKISKSTPANYNQKGKKWEREASIELLKANGEIGFTQDIGIRIYGGYSRGNAQKSFALFACKNYDDTEYFLYDFFNSKKIEKVSKILLRTSATDAEYALFRDSLIQSLVQKPMILDTQRSMPCILYINGEYYGIYSIKDAYDKSYISSNYNIDEEDVVIVKNPTGVTGADIEEGYIGDDMYYNRMIDYTKQKDIRMDSSYNYINTQIDIENYIEYNILQIYSDNRDWPSNNVCIWRKRTQAYEQNINYGHDGRWRWLVYDLDYGFGLYEGESSVMNNSLARANEINGPKWPNPPWSTLLLRTLLKSGKFKNQFINTFADRLNTVYTSEAVLKKIEDMEKIYYPNIENHIIRWNLHGNNVNNWLNEIDILKNFATKRPEYMRKHIVEYFGLSGIATIRVGMSEGGSVKVNSLNIENSDIPWKGIYFKDIPITVEAISKPGYEFVCWEGTMKSQDKTITINLSQPLYLKATFKKWKK